MPLDNAIIGVLREQTILKLLVPETNMLKALVLLVEIKTKIYKWSNIYLTKGGIAAKQKELLE